MPQTSDTPESKMEHVVSRRPCVEGCNVGTWIGFKHVTYLCQEAVLDCLRSRGLSMGKTFEEYGLGVQTVGCQLRLTKALRVDDQPKLVVTSQPAKDKPEQKFRVRASTGADQCCDATLNLVWRTAGVELGEYKPAPPELAPYTQQVANVVPDKVSSTAAAAVMQELRSTEKTCIVRSNRIAYPDCCYTSYWQFSGQVQLVEQLVDEFLLERGLGIADILRERRWIPVVSRFDLQSLQTVFMGEQLFSVFTLTEVLKNLLFRADIRCYVLRNGHLTEVMSSHIEHAYLNFQTRSVEATITPMDDLFVKALAGGE